jgi:hypothetical protein
MLATLKIDVLKEVKEQVLSKTTSNDYTGEEKRAYLDVVDIIDGKIKTIRHTPQLR